MKKGEVKMKTIKAVFNKKIFDYETANKIYTGICPTCGVINARHNSSHIIPWLQAYGLRLFPFNVIVQCANCNKVCEGNKTRLYDVLQNREDMNEYARVCGHADIWKLLDYSIGRVQLTRDDLNRLHKYSHEHLLDFYHPLLRKNSK